MLGSRPLSRTTAFAPRRDSRREKPFHQELPSLSVASPKHNPKLPILSISYLSRFPSRCPAFRPVSRFPSREKPFHQERPALYVASPNHNPKTPHLRPASYLPSRFVPASRFVPVPLSVPCPAFRPLSRFPSPLSRFPSPFVPLSVP